MNLDEKVKEIQQQIKDIEMRIEADKTELSKLKKQGREYSKLIEKAKSLDK